MSLSQSGCHSNNFTSPLRPPLLGAVATHRLTRFAFLLRALVLQHIHRGNGSSREYSRPRRGPRQGGQFGGQGRPGETRKVDDRVRFCVEGLLALYHSTLHAVRTCSYHTHSCSNSSAPPFYYHERSRSVVHHRHHNKDKKKIQNKSTLSQQKAIRKAATQHRSPSQQRYESSSSVTSRGNKARIDGSSCSVLIRRSAMR
jgi:hypothetical protein